MNETEIKTQLMAIVADAASFCYYAENCHEFEKYEFIENITKVLPKLYLDFSEKFDEDIIEDEELLMMPSYVSEDHYNDVRNKIASLLEHHDSFLETFEEDMKYSDTPIAASISESLADIFQVLYNFISIVKESNGENLKTAYKECKEYFTEYWSQTLCNVMRPLNQLRFNYEED